MKTKIAINGFGRIGRNAFKIAFERNDIEIVAINDQSDTRSLAHLLQYDSTYGTYGRVVGFDEDRLKIDSKSIQVFAQKNIALLPWGDLEIDVVIEATGHYTDGHKALIHVNQAGARKVVISAPSSSEDVSTLIMGVNENNIPASLNVISAGSCTTNCTALILDILNRNIGVEKAMMTTVHSYTNSQRLLDSVASNLREARSAAENIVPTSTGASIAVTRVLPNLISNFESFSIRVPSKVVSLADFVVITKQPTNKEFVNNLFKKVAADSYYQGLLAVNNHELVSSDYIGDSHSATVDLDLTDVIGDNMLKVVAWYDNEWGYSNRLIELAADVGKALHNKTDKHIAYKKETHI